jgi:hypothetical protein
VPTSSSVSASTNAAIVNMILLWVPVGHHCCSTAGADVGPSSGMGRSGLRQAENRASYCRF